MAAPAVSLPELLEEQGIYLLKQDNSLAEAEKEEALAALKTDRAVEQSRRNLHSRCDVCLLERPEQI